MQDFANQSYEEETEGWLVVTLKGVSGLVRV